MGESIDNKNDTDFKSQLNKDNSPGIISSFSSSEEMIRKIPLFAENFDVTKRIEETQLNLTKKWVTTTKKIEMPVKYEEILVNDKALDSYNEHEVTEIFTKLKHKITDVFSSHESEHKDKDDGQNPQHNHQKHTANDIEVKVYDEHSNKESNSDQKSSSEKPVPFSLDGKNDDGTMVASSDRKEENIITLWGEEIIINKKMVKIGEIVIRKYQTNEKQKIDVDIKKEKLTIKYPNDHKEEIQ
jgi:stress response protein YsnF